MTKKVLTPVLLTSLVAAGLAGCGGRDPSTAPSSPASAATNRAQVLALGQQWVQCLRSHGLTRMPDPELSQDGYLQFPLRADYNWKVDLARHQSIIDACQPIEDRYPPNAIRPKQQFSAADVRKLTEYAKCVRAHGIPAFPDPDSDGEFDLRGTSLANGIPQELRDQADQACRSIWSGDVKIHGGGGKVGGGKK